MASMDDLIKKVNKLQDAFSATGSSNPIDLPQIVVIGSQSSGKSSVLENIVGRDFLPRGTGIVTRRPLILQLINVPGNQKDGGDGKDGDSAQEGEEWGEFLHQPGKKFFNFSEIRDEIVRDTELKTGKNAGISPLPINLRVYSPKVLTLTLVDLPGLTKVPVGDQPKDIENQIRDMIMKFIGKSNAIILAVTAANTDLANSDGLKLAREVDPEGVRTVGVLTKVDLMDSGTDVVDILTGKIIPLRLGYVPVVNRGQRDIENKKTINAALDAEKKFFESHQAYSSKAQYCGTPFLARKLNLILMVHIRNCLPEIKAKISSGLVKYQTELAQLGDPLEEGNSSGQILNIITEFCNEFRTLLDGNANELSANELSGGARISFVLHEIFANAIKSFDPFENVKDMDIRTIMYNSSGSAPALFVGTTAFEVIVKQQIKRLEDPSLKCVNMVYDELVRILGQLLQKPVFRRFPNLRDRFNQIVITYFKKCINPTNKLVSDMIMAESCYINTAHPDFISGHKAMALVNERMNPKPATPNEQSPAGKGGKGGYGGSSGSSNPKHDSNNDLFAQTQQKDDGFFSSFFANKSSKSKKSGQLEPPPSVLKASGNSSDREIMETEVIKLLIASYYNVVKRTVSDIVPKAIMLNLVMKSKEDLQRELLTEIYSKRELVEESMKESEFVQQRRQEVKKMIAALEKANEIVSTV
ncbi:hypothetical protein MP228_001381 [Amoeboaphelidium protococcarum]|nr:hypothetical protein MP228_001381 [Amoeboaphelidium protococcarum]